MQGNVEFEFPCRQRWIWKQSKRCKLRLWWAKQGKTAEVEKEKCPCLIKFCGRFHFKTLRSELALDIAELYTTAYAQEAKGGCSFP